MTITGMYLLNYLFLVLIKFLTFANLARIHADDLHLANLLDMAIGLCWTTLRARSRKTLGNFVIYHFLRVKDLRFLKKNTRRNGSINLHIAGHVWNCWVLSCGGRSASY
jgi:hypothetical protein